MSVERPVILCLSGHDPTGGAGIQADIEAIFSLDGRPCTVVTALTEQDTRDVYRVLPQDPACFTAQAERVLADLPVAVIKIGLLGSASIARAVAALLRTHAALPVVFDPVLAAGGGAELASRELLHAVREELLPLTSLLTPNSVEARRLADRSDLDDCAAMLLQTGCRHVLITGTHEDGADVINRLHGQGSMSSYRWPRLPGSYHGSGCTLAAAIAALIGRGFSIEVAVERAQRYTWNALRAAEPRQAGQALPDRRARPD
ncbi:MAG: hydroxymethylpyrimidine/phosphomethylpyrimidine kinase [Methylotetracoccus sp.]